MNTLTFINKLNRIREIVKHYESCFKAYAYNKDAAKFIRDDFRLNQFGISDVMKERIIDGVDRRFYKRMRA